MRRFGLTLALVLTLPLAACVHGATSAARTVPVSQNPATTGRAAAAARTVAAPTVALRAALTERRRHHLDVLHAYRVAGVFPINTTIRGDGHFLIDPRGTLCAVANLIAQDGHRDAIVALSQTNNALLFGDVKDGEVMDWILSSGFSQEEIAQIQAPAPDVGDIEPDVDEPQPEVLAANAQVSASLTAIEDRLRSPSAEAAGVELALQRLAGRPELVAAILRAAPSTQVASAEREFAAPPPAR